LERSDSIILASVIDDLRRRELKGLETYGTTMDRKDLTNEEWMTHLYEELLDASLYLKKLINATQRRTNLEKTNSGDAGENPTSGSFDYIRAALREIPEGEPEGGGNGSIELETEDEDSEGEDRLLICTTEIEAAVNALSVIEGRDEMLISGQERRMVQEINAMTLHITYRALAEIYQSVFFEQLTGDGVDD
jgi:hypothetical protein